MDDEDRRVFQWQPSPAERLRLDDKDCGSFLFKCGPQEANACPEGCYSVKGPSEMVTRGALCTTCDTGMIQYDAQVACVCPTTHEQAAADGTWRCADKPYFDELTGSGTRFTIGQDFCCDMQRFNDTPEGIEAWRWMGCPAFQSQCPRPSLHTSDIVKNMCVDANLARILITNVEVDLENTARDFRRQLN